MKKTSKEILRMCCGCRQPKLKKDMTRLYLDDGSVLRVDRTGKSGGRGVYICKDMNCVERALKTGAIGHGLKHTLTREEAMTARELLLNEIQA